MRRLVRATVDRGGCRDGPRIRRAVPGLVRGSNFGAQRSGFSMRALIAVGSAAAAALISGCAGEVGGHAPPSRSSAPIGAAAARLVSRGVGRVIDQQTNVTSSMSLVPARRSVTSYRRRATRKTTAARLNLAHRPAVTPISIAASTLAAPTTIALPVRTVVTVLPTTDVRRSVATATPTPTPASN